MCVSINEVELFSRVRKFVNDVETGRYAENPDTFIALMNEFFAKPIQWRYNFSSTEVWCELNKVLEKLQLNANAFVPQENIDAFLMKVIDMRELKMFKDITSSDWIMVSDEVKKLYSEAIYEVGTTVACVKKVLTYNLRERCFSRVKMPGAVDAKSHHFYMGKTPSGQVGVHITIADGRTTIILALSGKHENNQRPAILDITSSCRSYLTKLA